MSGPQAITERAALAACARLFAQLTLFELEPGLWGQLSAPGIGPALAELGLELPSAFGPAEADALAAEFLDTFLRPEAGGPPVQSLWTEGSYEGQSAVMVRRLAEAAGIEFDKRAARGAPHDHIGCILLLWAQAETDAPEVAERLARDHMRWALEPLGRAATGAGFYGGVARALGRLILQIAA